MRRAGIVLPLYSLPGDGPVGAMGPDAYEFVDFLKSGGISLWQVLPIHPPVQGNSPYSAVSVFAGNPYFISPRLLARDGFISPDSLPGPGGPDEVEYVRCESELPAIWREAFQNGFEREREAVAGFRADNAYWVEDYALFMALREESGRLSYHQWERGLLFREPEAMEKARERLADEVDFWCFLQMLFFRQWFALKEYANTRGIQMLGDLPIYVDQESADVWAHPLVFQLDSKRRPSMVAGVPPDAFSADGQRWGNPLYDWDYLRRHGYIWWVERMRLASSLYDSIRIDHFRGLDEYYAIPAEQDTARFGSWRKGPGIAFLRKIQEEFPNCALVAEDLGLLGDSVRRLLRESGLPGMKVLAFAFTPYPPQEYLPHNFTRNCYAYIGTHDNDTALGWLSSGPRQEVEFARRYLRLESFDEPQWAFIHSLYQSVADTVMVQMQDCLGLGSECRTNTPGIALGNWRWRMSGSAPYSPIGARLRELGGLYGRLAP